jgi:hypothetical protein
VGLHELPQGERLDDLSKRHQNSTPLAVFLAEIEHIA